MKKILFRIKKAFKTGGIKEIVRKFFFLILYKVNGLFTLLRVKLSFYRKGTSDRPRDTMVVVSLTSYPKRFNTIGLCLKSLILQRYKPDKIILYLGNDTTEGDIPLNIKRFEKYGVEFRIDHQHNYKSHKKYFYAMQEFPEAIIVTADDDLIYPGNWLDSMMKQHVKTPDYIVSRRVHLIRAIDGTILPYDMWISQCRTIKKPAFELLGTSGSGKLYPPHSLCQETFNSYNFMRLCSGADDIWIKCMEVLSQKKNIWVKNWKVDLISTLKDNSGSLENENVGQQKNDFFLEQVMQEYNLNASDFFK